MKKIVCFVAVSLMLITFALNVFADSNKKTISPTNEPIKIMKVANNDDPINRLEKEMNSNDTRNIAFGAMSPGLRIAGIVLIIFGIVLVVGAIGFLSVTLIKALFGKGRVAKYHILLSGAALFLGLLLVGGSYFGLFKFGNDVIIEPVNDKILNGQSQQQDQQQGQNQPNEQQQNQKKSGE